MVPVEGKVVDGKVCVGIKITRPTHRRYGSPHNSYGLEVRWGLLRTINRKHQMGVVERFEIFPGGGLSNSRGT